MPIKIGLFSYEPDTVSRNQACRLREISHLFTEDVLENIVKPMVEGDHQLSLRLIDFVCVNFSKKKQVCYKVQRKDGHEVVWNLHQSYREWLRVWRRRNFDVFRRRQRIWCLKDEKRFETTIGQLNFFSWLIQFDVIKYCMDHKEILENDMIQTLKNARDEVKKNKRKRRQQISKKSNQSVTMIHGPRTIVFDED